MRPTIILGLVTVLSVGVARAAADVESTLASLDGPLTQERLNTVRGFAVEADSGKAIPRVLGWMEERVPSRDVIGCLLLESIVRAHPAEAPSPAALEKVLMRRNATSLNAGLSALRVVVDAGGKDLTPNLAQALVLLTTSQRQELVDGAVGSLKSLSGKTLPSDPDAWAEWFRKTFQRDIDLKQGTFEILAFIEPEEGRSSALVNGVRVADLEAVKALLRNLASQAKGMNVPLSVEIYGGDAPPQGDLPENVSTLMTAAASAAASHVSVVFRRRQIRPPYTAGEPQARPSYVRLSDIKYGERDGNPLLLSAFIPHKTEKAIGVVWIVSAEWESSHELLEGGIADWVEPLTQKGYAVFGVQQGAGRVAAMVEDIGRALAYLNEHHDRFGVRRFALLGHSSGGHLALLATLQSPPRAGESVVGVVAVAAPTDLTGFLGGPIPPDVRTAFFGEKSPSAAEANAIAKRLSPIAHLKDGSIPILLVHGTEDKVVPVAQARQFVESAKAAGADTQLIEVNEHGHIWNGLELAGARVLAWLDSKMSAGK